MCVCATQVVVSLTLIVYRCSLCSVAHRVGAGARPRPARAGRRSESLRVFAHDMQLAGCIRYRDRFG
jgi:hypothetical protein